MTDNLAEEQKARMFTVGMICAQWAYLEFLFAASIWVLLKVPDEDVGKIITGTLDMKGRAAMALRLARALNQRKELIDALAIAQQDSANQLDERNLVVHGVGELRPTGETYQEVHRGPMRNKPQPVSLRSIVVGGNRQSNQGPRTSAASPRHHHCLAAHIALKTFSKKTAGFSHPGSYSSSKPSPAATMAGVTSTGARRSQCPAGLSSGFC
jgi:predicted RNA-binding protein YlqC (UPF0109 family)